MEKLAAMREFYLKGEEDHVMHFAFSLLPMKTASLSDLTMICEKIMEPIHIIYILDHIALLLGEFSKVEK